jgi:hypothetical protein
VLRDAAQYQVGIVSKYGKVEEQEFRCSTVSCGRFDPTAPLGYCAFVAWPEAITSSDWFVRLIREQHRAVLAGCGVGDLGLDQRVYSFAHAPNFASFGRERAGEFRIHSSVGKTLCFCSRDAIPASNSAILIWQVSSSADQSQSILAIESRIRERSSSRTVGVRWISASRDGTAPIAGEGLTFCGWQVSR